MTLGLHPEIFNAKDATLRQEKDIQCNGRDEFEHDCTSNPAI
jgi:hypothetical protein